MIFAKSVEACHWCLVAFLLGLECVKRCCVFSGTGVGVVFACRLALRSGEGVLVSVYGLGLGQVGQRGFEMIFWRWGVFVSRFGVMCAWLHL